MLAGQPGGIFVDLWLECVLILDLLDQVLVISPFVFGLLACEEVFEGGHTLAWDSALR